MPQCAVATCRNSHRKTKGRRVRYHRFPAEDDVRIRWVSVCGRGGSSANFNPSTARVCSLHFSPNSYERDVEHELLGLTPRSRLKKGAVPDRGVPISLPSLINKRRPPPRQRQQQVTKGGKRKNNARRPPYQDYEDEEDYPVKDPNGFDILLAVGLKPRKNLRRDDLNRMHVMAEESGNKSSAVAQIDADAEQKDALQKDNGVLPDNAVAGEKAPPVVDVKENGDKERSTGDVADETGSHEDHSEDNDEGDAIASKDIKREEGKETEPADGSPDLVCVPDLLPKEDEVPTDTKTEDQPEAAPTGNRDADSKTDVSLPGSPGDAAEEESGGSGNDDKASDDRKRECSDSDSDTPSVAKKMKMTQAEYEERANTVNDFVESATGASLEEIQRCSEKIQQEVETLSAMARAKEHEWNNIIRLKKVKEEMFIRLQRKRQVMMIMMGTEGRETADWDLSSDMRYGESSGVGESSRVKDANRNNLRNSDKSRKNSSRGISLLKNNQHPNSLMMVPIVSSSPNNFPTSVSSLSQSQSGSVRLSDAGNRDRTNSRIHRPILPKPTGAAVNGNNGNNGLNPVIGEGRQGPILDVRSIIADYRSRHPETVPRRGRRLKTVSPPPTSGLPENLVSSSRVSGAGGILSMANLALGSGSQMRTGVVGSTSVEMGELGLLLTAVGEAARQESSRPSSADSTRSGAPSQNAGEGGGQRSNISFKDVLVQFAKMSQSEQRMDHLPATNATSKLPPYPDVTLHPVPSPPSPPAPASSLLHGILTKASGGGGGGAQRPDNSRPATFSPTLARLLTAPERVPNNAHQGAPAHFRPGHVSISDLLSTSKQTRNEITITPVAAHQPIKSKQDSVLEEQEDSADRLVIDETAEMDGGRERADADEEHGSVQDVLAEDVPECQGCHQRTAQFVCAGCGNQWYCSRECQVTAWDEHSDVCSG